MAISKDKTPLQKMAEAAKTPLGISVITAVVVLASAGGVAAAANGSKPAGLSAWRCRQAISPSTYCPRTLTRDSTAF